MRSSRQCSTAQSMSWRRCSETAGYSQHGRHCAAAGHCRRKLHLIHRVIVREGDKEGLAESPDFVAKRVPSQDNTVSHCVLLVDLVLRKVLLEGVGLCTSRACSIEVNRVYLPVALVCGNRRGGGNVQDTGRGLHSWFLQEDHGGFSWADGLA